MFWGGLVEPLLGVGIITAGTILSRRKKLTERPTIPAQRVRSRMSNRGTGVMAIALTVIAFFVLFAIWPPIPNITEIPLS
jgi:hypothetical protein